VAMISTMPAADFRTRRGNAASQVSVAPNTVIREIDIYVLGLHARLRLAHAGMRRFRGRRNDASTTLDAQNAVRL
jgi:hypothetical protein